MKLSRDTKSKIKNATSGIILTNVRGSEISGVTIEGRYDEIIGMMIAVVDTLYRTIPDKDLLLGDLRQITEIVKEKYEGKNE